MNAKKFFILLLAAGLITAVALSVSHPKNSQDNSTKSSIASQNEEKAIKENIKLYHPKETKNTNFEDIGVNALSAIVFDNNSGKILYQKNPHEKLPPASITKIATFSIVLENMKYDKRIEISQKAADQEPNKIVMRAGEKMRVDDLLYGLMMISANDAAYALAEADTDGFDGFIRKMNKLVKNLGLKNTNFENPSGLDGENHYSSAFDIATLTRYALIKHPEIIKYAGRKEDHSVYPNEFNESHWWGHISGMLYRYPGMIAAKTGYTDIAKSTFVGIAERNNRRLAVVFLGSTDANGDVVKLLDYGFTH